MFKIGRLGRMERLDNQRMYKYIKIKSTKYTENKVTECKFTKRIENETMI